ncbi:hypothetical protein P153DRAFT_206619 [Dothidotthia symphoricarpi CBS 119687]|uniref:WH2 domain-containing protein n=1 Tax=Dothidotthia symphoricarpi CBS 119687 TaxID=1392245 RepID=A0A6A6AJ33_9PLEO|nr:uncharacterized protein P153DRAFT_206619 [Dothidotthia symphoricarpi CBS 119687]KAF2130914.1 hypothetical protein P153DRAFT_206619 [Dothidotthia symphoricarpi CBS 119687]
MPDQDSEAYRKQVQTHIQDLMSGNRPRDPQLAAATTGRLVLEGVVEAVKMYREHKQETKEQGKKDGERHGHKSKDGHHGGSREGHGHRSGERKHRHGSGERHHHRSKERRKRSGSRERQKNDREIVDPVREGRNDDDSRFVMTGGAGAPSTQPTSIHNAEHRARSPPRRERPVTPAGQVGASHSPTQPRIGPDGTSFGDLPRFKMKKGPAMGFVAHAMNTYRHVKAEQEAGLRSKGMLEKHVDGWREKRGGAKPADSQKIRKGGQGGKDDREDDEPAARDWEKIRVSGPGMRGGDRDGRLRGSQEQTGGTGKVGRQAAPPTSTSSPAYQTISQPRSPTPFHGPPPITVTPPSVQQTFADSPIPSAPSYPPQSFHAPQPAPTPASFSAPSHSPSIPVPPPMPPMPQASPLPPPPPPPAPSRAPNPPSNQHATLFSAIRGGTNLRKVPTSEQKDNSSAKETGKPIYPETPHSHDVEAQEHAQDTEEQERDQAESKCLPYKPEVRRLLTYSWFEPEDECGGLE